MKKILLATLIIAAFAGTQNVAEAKPNFTIVETGKRVTSLPTAVVEAYNTMYPGAQTIKWSRKGEVRYQVVFNYNGQKLTASYSYTGVYLGN